MQEDSAYNALDMEEEDKNEQGLHEDEEAALAHHPAAPGTDDGAGGVRAGKARRK